MRQDRQNRIWDANRYSRRILPVASFRQTAFQPGILSMRLSSLLPLVLLPLVAGCLLPRTTVHKHPGPGDLGVRYYRPKPYLFLKPMTDRDGLPVDGYVSIEQVTLPDYSEEYPIHVRSGLGTNDTEIRLEDGWNLTALNVSVDSQFDENLKAVADVIEAVPRATASGREALPAMAVRATNVPLGLYESVISTGPDCKKRLYGFRYVGFLPYAPCPVESCGVEQAACCASDLYGLVFESGTMVFRPLGQLSAHLETSRIKIEGESAQVSKETLPKDSLLEEDPFAAPLLPPTKLPESEGDRGG